MSFRFIPVSFGGVPNPSLSGDFVSPPPGAPAPGGGGDLPGSCPCPGGGDLDLLPPGGDLDLSPPFWWLS